MEVVKIMSLWRR